MHNEQISLINSETSINLSFVSWSVTFDILLHGSNIVSFVTTLYNEESDIYLLQKFYRQSFVTVIKAWKSEYFIESIEYPI